MLITFEGLDQAGKSTQIELLTHFFQSKGRHVIVLREPGGTVIGEKIRDILLDKKNLHMVELAEMFLFSASRAQLTREVIKPALARNEIVILDRFFDSTTAYQGYGRGISLVDIKAINRVATEGIIPDATIVLDISIDEMEGRRIKAGKTSDRMESNTKEFYNRVRQGYLHVAEGDDRFQVFNALQPADEIHRQIVNFIQKSLL